MAASCCLTDMLHRYSKKVIVLSGFETHFLELQLRMCSYIVLRWARRNGYGARHAAHNVERTTFASERIRKRRWQRIEVWCPAKQCDRNSRNAFTTPLA